MSDPELASSSSRNCRTLALARAALGRVAARLPELAGLAHRVRVQITPRVAACGVFRSGRIVVNPTWFAALSPAEATFVIAHELMHLLLRTHERAVGFEVERFNMAHDAVINDDLAARLQMGVPAGGVALPGARFLSAEQLILGGVVTQAPAEGDWDSDDVLDDDREADFGLDASGLCDLGPIDEPPGSSIAIKLDEQTVRKASLALLEREFGSHAPEPLVRATKGPDTLAFERALACALDGRERSGRSFASASRRAAACSDIVLPGRRRGGTRLDVLLDTSSSMVAHLPLALGGLRNFCLSADVAEVRIVHTDGTALAEVRRAPDELESLRVLARGDQELFVPADVCEGCGVRHAFRIEDAAPTSLHAGFAWLGRDPEVETVVVITDGFVTTPTTHPPFAVQWALMQSNPRFAPRFGEIWTFRRAAG
jgi:hypothetical protein